MKGSVTIKQNLVNIIATNKNYPLVYKGENIRLLSTLGVGFHYIRLKWKRVLF